MYTVVVILHILVCLILIMVILLQAGKGGGIAGAFGGSGTGMDSYFGAQGAATFLTKVTVILVVIFMTLCVVHSFLVKPGKGGPKSVLEEMAKTRGGGNLPEPTPLDEESRPAPQPQSQDQGQE